MTVFIVYLRSHVTEAQVERKPAKLLGPCKPKALHDTEGHALTDHFIIFFASAT